MKKVKNPTLKKLGYMPEAIMIHVPEAFFKHKNGEGFGETDSDREEAFRRFYETMHKRSDETCFYHFISSCPATDIAEHITHIYVCFKGKVQYKAILVKFMRNQPVHDGDYHHPEPRDWCVTTGPVEKPKEDILLSDVWKGARQGFRYTKELF